MEPAHRSNVPRIAFFGGSFDPPHLGHLAIARASRSALQLDKVLFAPVGAQPLKPNGSTASFEDRLAMTRLAIAGEAGFEVSLADAPKPAGKPNYTLDTLKSLREGMQSDAALFCLIGADSFFGLKGWHRAAEIPFVASLIVASRPGQRPEEWMEGLRAALPVGLRIDQDVDCGGRVNEVELRTYSVRNSEGARAPLYLLPGLNADISASDIRERIRGLDAEQMGASATDSRARAMLLPDAVLKYILAHRLYC